MIQLLTAGIRHFTFHAPGTQGFIKGKKRRGN